MGSRPKGANNLKLPKYALFLCLPAVVLAASARPMDRAGDSVGVVAAISLPGFLASIPSGQEGRYGFHDRDEFARATVGNPIEVYIARPALRDSLPWKRDTSWNRPVALGRWRVPVLVDSQTRCFLTVEKTNGVWEAVDLGAMGLAQEMAKFDSTHPAKRRALLRLDALRADVVLLDRTGAGWDEGEYHPLKSARTFFPSDSGRPRSRADMFGNLHRLYREHQFADR